MSSALLSRNQLYNLLFEALLETAPLMAIRCSSYDDAIKLRLRLNKIRAADRKAQTRALEKAKVNPATVENVSQFDRLVFQVKSGEARVLIHRGETLNSDPRSLLVRVNAQGEEEALPPIDIEGDFAPASPQKAKDLATVPENDQEGISFAPNENIFG